MPNTRWDTPRIVITAVLGVLLVAMLIGGIFEWTSPESRVQRCINSHMENNPGYNYMLTVGWCRDQITPGWADD